MLVQRQVAVFGLLAAQCLGSHVIHEKRHETPKTWMKGTRLDLNDIFNVRIGLAQSNLDSSHELLMDVSDPNSPNYGKFWTGQKVIDTFAPSNDTVSTVQNWLEGSGIESSRIIVSKNKAWMMFNATVSEAEQLFHAEYYEFENLERGATTVACDESESPCFTIFLTALTDVQI
jgi:tripeptidyl-peptidase-1